MSPRLVCWFGVLLAVGCTKQASVPPGPEKEKPAKVEDALPIVIPQSPGPTIDATTYAADFLRNVHAGTAAAGQLTPQFKKVIAEPVFEADQAVGYSDAAADNWLKQYQGKLSDVKVTGFGSAPGAQLFTATVPGERKRFITLRLAKAENAWRVDWFFPAETGLVAMTPTGDAQTFAAGAFLTALTGQNSPMAAGLMAPDAKKRLAPPFAGEKRAFNSGILDQKLASYRGGFTGFTLAKVENGTASGVLNNPGTSKPFTLKLVAGERSFDWLVDDVKVD